MVGFDYTEGIRLEELLYGCIIFLPASRSIMIIISSASMKVNANKKVSKIFQKFFLVCYPEVLLGGGMADVMPVTYWASRKFSKKNLEFIKVREVL